MNSILVLFSISVAMSVSVLATDLYTTRYDTINIDTILNSQRLVINYADCLLSRRPCPPEGKALKRILPEALRTKCSRCSVMQKENALKVIRKLHDHFPVQWKELAERWDPTGEYRRRYEEYLRNELFNSIPEDNKNVQPSSVFVGSRFGESDDETPAPSSTTITKTSNPTKNNISPVQNQVDQEVTRFQPRPPIRSVAPSSSDVNKVYNKQQPCTTPTATTVRLPDVQTRLPGLSFQASAGIGLLQPITDGVRGIINSLGGKVQETANLFAGVVRGTVNAFAG